MACEILVPRPGFEPMPSVLEVWSLNPWTAMEGPTLSFSLTASFLSFSNSEFVMFFHTLNILLFFLAHFEIRSDPFSSVSGHVSLLCLHGPWWSHITSHLFSLKLTYCDI